MGFMKGCFTVVLAMFVISIVVGVVMEITNTSNVPSGSDDSAPSPPSLRDLKREAMRQVDISEWSWSKGGFDNIMKADFTVKNGSRFDIKDIEIKCVHSAKSGTRIDSNTRTIYEIIKAGETKQFKDFNMGFIHTQAEKSSASIEDFVIIP
jgi:hypothetical protein